MTVRKAAPAKAAAPRTKTTAPKTTKPSPEQRIAALETLVAEQGVKIDNLAKFIAAGVAQQLQAQLMGSPDLQAQLAAFGEQQQAGK